MLVTNDELLEIALASLGKTSAGKMGRNFDNLFRVLVFVGKHHNMSSAVGTTPTKIYIFS